MVRSATQFPMVLPWFNHDFFFFFFLQVRSGRALNPHPHTRFFRGFFAVQKFFDYTISLRKSENPILYSKGTSDSFWTHM